MHPSLIRVPQSTYCFHATTIQDALVSCKFLTQNIRTLKSLLMSVKYLWMNVKVFME